MIRDEFKKPVKEDLARRVSYECSNPECRARTLGPKQASTGFVNLGVAAHIAAAAAGGPRYDVTMSSDERSAFGNGIWLCLVCSVLVDRDVDAYPVKLLQDWKQKAEARALLSINKRDVAQTWSIGPHEHIDATRALQHIGLSLKQITRSLQNVDPRFDVTVSYNSKGAFVEFSPKSSPLPIALRIVDVPDYQERVRRFIDFGAPMKFDSQAVKLSGSPLFDLIPASGSTVVVGNSSSLPVTITLYLSDGPRLPLKLFEQSSFSATRGEKGLHCATVFCGGLLTFEATITDGRVSFTAQPQYEKWVGKEVSSLPFFEKIKRFHKASRRGGLLKIDIEICGQNFAEASGPLSPVTVGFGTMDFIDQLRKLVAHSDVSVLLPDPTKITTEDVNALRRVSLYGRFGNGAHFSMKIGISTDDENQELKGKVNSRKPMDVKMSQPFSLPSVASSLTDRMLSVNISDVLASSRSRSMSAGRSIEVRFTGTRTTAAQFMVEPIDH